MVMSTQSKHGGGETVGGMSITAKRDRKCQFFLKMRYVILQTYGIEIKTKSICQ